MRKITKIQVWYSNGFRVSFVRNGFSILSYSVSYKQIKRLEKVLSCYGPGGIRPYVKYDLWAVVAEYEIR